MRPEPGGYSTLEFDPAVSLEIEETRHGWFLFRYDVDGTFCGDTWHETFDQAKAQTTFEYEVPADSWTITSEAPPTE